MRHHLLTLLLTLLVSSTMAQTATDTTLYEVQTLDGNVYQGYLMEDTNEYIVFETKNLGRITIQRSDIESLIEMDQTQLKEDGYWFDNPQAARYFFQPNGYGLKKGESYYQNIWVLWNQMSFGMSDNFSLGIGIVPTFLFAGASSPVWITPKVSIPIVEDKFNIGGGALIGTILGEQQSGFGITYGVATLGSKDYNASIGLGYGYENAVWSSNAIITASALLRLSKKGYFITENYFFDEVTLLSFGARFILKKVGIDVALLVPSDTGETVFFPLLGITIPFGETPDNLK